MSAPTPAWQTAFQEHTGQWAFILSLSRRMVFTLTLIRDGDNGRSFVNGVPTMLGPRSGHWIPAANSLVTRGLVEHEHKEWQGLHGKECSNTWKLTKAGVLVCELLVLAGLMQAAIKKRNRVAA